MAAEENATCERRDPADLQTNRQSGLVRFLDSFFQERNIKWMLGIGLAILVASSLMLVTAQWERYHPALKHLILL